MSTTKPQLALIAALDRHHLIGAEGDMPWHLPADLQHFKALTLNHTVIMGRRTFASIGRALPKRRNIVLSRQSAFSAPNCETAHSLEEALRLCADEDKVFVIGGGALYRAAIAQADVLHLTHIDGEFQGDTYFPALDPALWQAQPRAHHSADADNAYSMDFIDYLRRKHGS